MATTDDYLDARSAFERVSSEVNAVATMLSQVGESLKRQPGKFIFSNTGLGLPPEASMSRDSLSANANDWKSPAQIQELLARWHDARSKMMSAWASLPDERRKGVQPPAGTR